MAAGRILGLIPRSRPGPSSSKSAVPGNDVLQGGRIGGSVKKCLLIAAHRNFPQHQTATVRLRGGGAERASGSCNQSCANIQLFLVKQERRFSCRALSGFSRESRLEKTTDRVHCRDQPRPRRRLGGTHFTGRISANGGGATSPKKARGLLGRPQLLQISGRAHAATTSTSHSQTLSEQ